MEGLISFLSKYCGVSSLLRERLFLVVQRGFYKKGAVLLKAGRRSDRIFFLSSGLVQWFGAGGVTMWFSLPGTIIYQPLAFALLDASSETLVAVKDCEVLFIGWEDVQQLCVDFPEMRIIERGILCEQQDLLKRHAVMLKCLDKEARVLYLISAFPGLIHFMDRESLGSFLGMSASTFRRLRLRLQLVGGI